MVAFIHETMQSIITCIMHALYKCVYKVIFSATLQGVLCTVSPWQHSKWTFDPRDWGGAIMISSSIAGRRTFWFMSAVCQTSVSEPCLCFTDFCLWIYSRSEKVFKWLACSGACELVSVRKLQTEAHQSWFNFSQIW